MTRGCARAATRAPARPVRRTARRSALCALAALGALGTRPAIAAPTIGAQTLDPLYDPVIAPSPPESYNFPSYRGGIASAAAAPTAAPTAAPAAAPAAAATTAADAVETPAAAAPEPDAPPPPPKPSPLRQARELARARAAAAESFRARSGEAFSKLDLTPGIDVAFLRMPGRRTAAARFALAGASLPSPGWKAGIDALALAAIAEELRAEAEAAGARLELSLGGVDVAALELTAPAEGFLPLLAAVARGLGSPFAAAGVAGTGVSASGFAAAQRDLRLLERRRAADPSAAAKDALRAGSWQGQSWAVPAVGDARGLATATLSDLALRWTSSPPAGRLSVAIAGDVDAASVERALVPALARAAAVDGAPAAALAARPASSPWSGTVPARGPGDSTLLRAEFDAPSLGSPAYPSLAVAMAALDDLLAAFLAAVPGCSGAVSGIEGGRAPRAFVEIGRAADAPAAAAAVERAAAVLAGGSCMDAAAAFAGLGPIESSLGAYKSRAIVAFYGSAGTPSGAAAAMSRGLVEGGRGDEYLAFAARVEAVSGAEVAEAARRFLAEAPAAWVAVRDPELSGGR